MKTMLDVSDIVLGIEYVQDFEVIRNENGRLFKGRYIQDSRTIPMSGTVSAVNDEDIQLIPEGDRNAESRTFYTVEPIYISRQNEGTEEGSGTSDVVVYNGKHYKIVSVSDLSDYGYYKAIGVKLSAND